MVPGGGAHGCVDCIVGMCGCALSRPLSHQATSGCEHCVPVCSIPKSPPNTELCTWSTIHPLCTLLLTNIMSFSIPHTSPSRFFHNCHSFFTMPSSSSPSFLRPVSVCMVVMKCNTRLHQSSTRRVCHFGIIRCGHHFALVLWLWCLLFTTPLCFTHTQHIWTMDVVEWHLRGFTQSTRHPLHQPLHLVVVTKVLTNDGFHFKVVWQVVNAHTQVQPINQRHQSAFQYLISHRMAQWVSIVDVTLATHHITITSTCFPLQTLYQW